MIFFFLLVDKKINGERARGIAEINLASIFGAAIYAQGRNCVCVKTHSKFIAITYRKNSFYFILFFWKEPFFFFFISTKDAHIYIVTYEFLFSSANKSFTAPTTTTTKNIKTQSC